MPMANYNGGFTDGISIRGIHVPTRQRVLSHIEGIDPARKTLNKSWLRQPAISFQFLYSFSFSFASRFG